MSERKSGIDSLLEALKESGIDFNPGGENPFAGKGTQSGGQGSSAGTKRTSSPKSTDGWSVITGGKGGGKGGSFTHRFAQFSRKAIIAVIIILLLVAAGSYWWFHPAINIHSEDCWSFVFTFILIPSFLAFFALHRIYTTGMGRREASPSKARTFKWLSWLPIIVAVAGLVGGAASLSLWPGNAARYSEILPAEQSDFATDIDEVNYDSVPVIDRDSAMILGNRTLGEIPEYVSQFEISSLYSQINYQGRPVRVSPLNYEDFFKWWNNREAGIPGYVIVDMTSQDTQVVRLDSPIYYSESEPFERNIDRYVQLKYPTYMFEEKSFEIDDDGVPYWVCPVQTRTIGLFGGEDIVRVVLVNASTGECTDYAIADCPQWVDRAYPSDLLIQQYNWYGSLNGGWLNSWLGQSGVVQTTPGTNTNLGYNYIAQDDDVWLYTGVTSATADNSIIGFVLVNQRTAEAKFYSVAGATEESAMRSAEGQVQNLGYDATFPLLLNINGQPTYFMALKDNAGLVKKFAMVDIQRYQNVAIGDTVSDCQKSYKALLATNGVSSGEDSGAKEVTGVIKNIAQAVVDGNSHFYITLTGDKHIFDCPLPAMIEAVAFAAGDEVTLTYVESEPTSTVSKIEAASTSDAAKATSSATTETTAASSTQGADSAKTADAQQAQSEEAPQKTEAATQAA